MSSRNLLCLCLIQCDDAETTVILCSRHTIDYIRCKGSDREFIKMIVRLSGKSDRIAHMELQ